MKTANKVKPLSIIPTVSSKLAMMDAAWKGLYATCYKVRYIEESAVYIVVDREMVQAVIVSLTNN